MVLIELFMWSLCRVVAAVAQFVGVVGLLYLIVWSAWSYAGWAVNKWR